MARPRPRRSPEGTRRQGDSAELPGLHREGLPFKWGFPRTFAEFRVIVLEIFPILTSIISFRVSKNLCGGIVVWPWSSRN